MSAVHVDPWEPEESVGKIWHAFASRLGSRDPRDDAAVAHEEVAGRLAVLFRALGGNPSVEIVPVPDEPGEHRLGWRRRLGAAAERLPRPSFDGEALRLPARLAEFPSREANGALYVWLAAAGANCPSPKDVSGPFPGANEDPDPLRADLRALRAARETVAATLSAAPGLADLYTALREAALLDRATPALPPVEARVEAALRHMLGDGLSPDAEDLWRAVTEGGIGKLAAPRRYRRFRPVPIWPETRSVAAGAGIEASPDDAAATRDDAEGARRRARRRRTGQAEREGGLVLHKFEAILSWAEMLDIDRRADDDDADTAARAADDLDEIGLGQVGKAPRTRLRMHLDLAPEDADRERLAAEFTYAEWDARSLAYMPDHVRVLAGPAEPAEGPLGGDPAQARRIRAVRRQFEALRPARAFTRGHLEGDALDLDAAIRARADLAAGRDADDRLWLQSRPVERDLAVSILVDASRSTESSVSGRSVIEIEREALRALAWGLDACGDEFSIHGFSSLRRDRVFVSACKTFDERMGRSVERRIQGLQPQFYTRLGAAIRHATAMLARRDRKRRLLLVVTDGKPDDLDHYEGRHGAEDTAMAVREARRAGNSVMAVTVDSRGGERFARMFGPGGFAIVPEPEKLVTALPRVFRQIAFG